MYWILALAMLLCACGSEKVEIATGAQLRVSFSERIVSVNFDLRPDFRLNSPYRKTFQQGDLLLARTYLNPGSAGAGAKLGAFAAPDDLRKAVFDEDQMKKFPNWKKLPRTVPSGALKVLSEEQVGATMEFLFQDQPYLIVGGSIRTEAFKDLPIGFLAHQYFMDSNKNITASLSLAGPTLLGDGGIYFLGYFGLNPFVLEQAEGEFNIPLVSEPMKIESWGLFRGDILDPQSWLRKFERSLEPWRSL